MVCSSFWGLVAYWNGGRGVRRGGEGREGGAEETTTGRGSDYELLGSWGLERGADMKNGRMEFGTVDLRDGSLEFQSRCETFEENHYNDDLFFSLSTERSCRGVKTKPRLYVHLFYRLLKKGGKGT